MSPPPRRLTFAVGTGLLTASLSLGVAGCDEQESNPGPTKADEKPTTEPPVTNIAPRGEGEQPEPKPEPDPEPVHVNERPEPLPEPALEPVHVNPGPEPAPNVNVVESPPKPAEPKRVNTQPSKE